MGAGQELSHNVQVRNERGFIILCFSSKLCKYYCAHNYSCASVHTSAGTVTVVALCVIIYIIRQTSAILHSVSICPLCNVIIPDKNIAHIVRSINHIFATSISFYITNYSINSTTVIYPTTNYTTNFITNTSNTSNFTISNSLTLTMCFQRYLVMWYSSCLYSVYNIAESSAQLASETQLQKLLRCMTNCVYCTMFYSITQVYIKGVVIKS